MSQRVKKTRPAIQETQLMRVRSLGWKDPFEEDVVKPLQDSRLENPMDRGARWPTVHGIASRTRLSADAMTRRSAVTQGSRAKRETPLCPGSCKNPFQTKRVTGTSMFSLRGESARRLCSGRKSISVNSGV